MNLIRVLRTTGFRLAALYAGLFGLSVLILFGTIYWITSDALRQQLSASIESETNALVEIFLTGDRMQLVDAIGQRTLPQPDPTVFYLLLDPAGQKLAGNLETLPTRPGWQELAPPRDSDGSDDNDESDESDGSDGGHIDNEEATDHRLLALGTALPDRSFLLVAEDTYRVVEAEEAITRAFGWALGITVLFGVVGGSVLSLGFLRRVDAINRTSRAIIEGNLTDRIRTRGTGDELDRLALNLNEMLDRIQALMDSLRQVSSDIAHDLRTPLSHLHQRLEGVRSKAHRLEDYEAAVDQAIVDTDSILATFAALLRIAQIESGSRKAAFSTVDLSGIFQSIVDTYGAVADDRGQILAAEIEPDVRVRGDRELLTQMLANLVENAIRHTPTGSRIGLSLKSGNGEPAGAVFDNGPGIPADARAQVFRRFYRLERSRSTPGSGLGLALVAAVADIHGIGIALVDNGPGLRVTLDFRHMAGNAAKN